MEKENENIKEENNILINEFIQYIYYIKRLYIYIIIKKHYCNDMKEKERIIKEGSNRVDIAKKELNIIYNKILVLLKKINGDKELIKYIRLIIIKLKEYQNINEEEIKEYKKLYKQDIVSFEKLKEKIKNNEKDNENINKEISKEQLKDNNNLIVNVNVDRRFGTFSRIWAVIIPFLYILHYFYYNFKNENNEYSIEYEY